MPWARTDWVACKEVQRGPRDRTAVRVTRVNRVIKVVENDQPAVGKIDLVVAVVNRCLSRPILGELRPDADEEPIEVCIVSKPPGGDVLITVSGQQTVSASEPGAA